MAASAVTPPSDDENTRLPAILHALAADAYSPTLHAERWFSDVLADLRH